MGTKIIEDAGRGNISALSIRETLCEQASARALAGRDFFRFGIPSLDQLFAPDGKSAAEYGIRLASVERASPSVGSTSLSFIGRSGTGKSVLALHFASRYLADCAATGIPGELPKVLYVSTDLTHARAATAWKAFGLNLPNGRSLPFEDYTSLFRQELSFHIDLKECLFGTKQIVEAIAEENSPVGPSTVNPTSVDSSALPPASATGAMTGHVHFIDLASSTAGDDWGFLMRLLALLPPRHPQQPKHLVIIDAVEGLETFAGSVDPHGHTRSRRSRIAQVLRTAADKCHIGFVLEESSSGNIPDEEFVSDVVLRLHSFEVDGYMRRTLEITKSRGGTHVRGRHNYIIRGGSGKVNVPDDPRNPSQGDDRPLAYFYVIQSLHWLTRNRGVLQPPVHDGSDYAKLDTPRMPRTLPLNGLPRGEVTVLTGDEATYKARFGRAFLSGCFRERTDNEAPRPKEKAALKEVALYVTTQNLLREDFIERLRSHLTTEKTPKREIDERVIFRQLEAHSLDSSTLFHIIRRCVEAAIQKVVQINNGAKQEFKWWERHPLAHLVRVVIDDWRNIEDSYPQIAKDSLFLPFLIRYLEETGITTLIVETSSGRPDEIFNAKSQRNLRALVRNHLMTWHVRFFGEDRVAMAAVPPLRDWLPSVVVELRAAPTGEATDANERLWADSHFEYYAGWQTGQPLPVPLEVNLFASAEQFPIYRDQTNAVFSRLFTLCPRYTAVVNGYEPAQYVALRECSQLLSGVRTPHTIVTQVDEYWRPAPRAAQSRTPALPESATGAPSNNRRVYGIEGYLAQPTTDPKGEPHRTTDPFFEFQPPRKEKKAKRYFRREFFKPEGFGDAWHEHLDKLSLVPYLWDFGFLLLRDRFWHNAKGKLASENPPAFEKVCKVWDYCVHRKQPAQLPWGKFFEACQLVAKAQGGHPETPVRSFDMDLLSPQTFACLVLEIWASEMPEDPSGRFRMFSHQRHDREHYLFSLAELLENYGSEFFTVWVWLGEAIDPAQILAENGYLRNHPAPNQAVAERHWYSTAAQVWRKLENTDIAVPGRLPGKYSTRGDWFLTVGSDSRSVRLGERAIDLLSRRKDNVVRMEMGLGLPMRDILPSTGSDAKRVRKILRTALVTADASGTPQNVTYEHLRSLGACQPGPLHWFWRSQIADYHRQDRIWERWLARFMKAANGWNQQIKAAGLNPFDPTLKLTTLPPGVSGVAISYRDMVKTLVSILKKLAQPPIEGDGPDGNANLQFHFQPIRGRAGTKK